jgi:2-hydroxychromene-2-carboxylate isomerase
MLAPAMIELWFDFSCPYAYLASRRVAALSLDVDWRPMLLGGVFRGIGAGDGPMATLSPQKAEHNYRDMHRWAAAFGVPFRMPSTHPMRTVKALRILLALPRSHWPAAIESIYAAYWQRAEDVSRDDVVASALATAGVDRDAIADAVARSESAEIKGELHRRTDEAISLGIFGAPAFVLRRDGRELLVWGQDRMHWLPALLAGWDPDADSPSGPSSSGPTRHPLAGGPRPFAPSVRAKAGVTLDVYFDVASPFSYLGLTQLPALAATGATPRLRPILVGALFRQVGQVDVPLFGFPPPKMRYTNLDMQRWARWWGVPFAMPSKFPQRTVTAQRVCAIAAEHGFEVGVRTATALARAMWAEQHDLEDADVLRRVLAAAALPVEWVDQASEPRVKQMLVELTESARAANVFGVPSFVVDGRVYWGQDRLDLVARALAGEDLEPHV